MSQSFEEFSLEIPPRLKHLSRRSIWELATASPYPPLVGERRYDIAIIGAGITGLTAARHLAGSGRSVCVLERNRVGGGTTNSSSAHLSTVPDLSLKTLIDRFGREAMAAFMRAWTRSLDDLEAVGQQSFRRVPGYLYAVHGSSDHMDNLNDEAHAMAELGIAVSVVDEPTFPVPIRAGPAV